jgi:hypothetical protein
MPLTPEVLLFLAFFHPEMTVNSRNNDLMNRIESVKGLVAVWDFAERTGKERRSKGPEAHNLREAGGKTVRIDDGPLSGYSAKFDGTNYLIISHSDTRDLNISGKDRGITVIAWVKWTGEQTGFVGGMWNEYLDGGKRQYGLFVSLPHYNGRNQVCGHISMTGKPTPPFPYSIDYSASRQVVPAGEWCSVAFTYDGKYIKSFLNGKFEARDPELISNTAGFTGYPSGLIQCKNPYYFPDGIGDNGSDFTVGAVLLKSGMGNFFKGMIGGLAVYNRSLNEDEISFISSFPVKNKK